MVEKCPICNGTRIVSRRMYETPGVTCSWDTNMNETDYIQCHLCNGTGIIWLNDMESQNTPKQNNARGTFVYPNACCYEYKGPVQIQISENKFVDENGNEIIYIPPSKR